MNDKLKMHTPNKADENFAKLAALFPNAVTEIKDEHGDIVRAIDKDVLMQEISATVVEGNEERYQFTWPDKKKSVLLANAPINKTLRPSKEESVNFDTTENLYIEGDNLEVLKLLQETYLGKIKMIYIDPPYNTGKDSFLYQDNFDMDENDFSSVSGQYDDNGNMLYDIRKNSESDGRFHTNWLNMMYPRLKLAKDLLSDDGMIFISIDDSEAYNLKRICDEIFGSDNLQTINYLQVRYADKTLTSDMNYHKQVEQVLVYSKQKDVQPYRKPIPYDYSKFEFEIEELSVGKEIVLGGKKVVIFSENEYRIKKLPEGNKNGLKEIWATGSILNGNSSGRFFRDYLNNRKEIDGLGVLYKVYGIGDDGCEYRYFTGPKKETATKGKYYQGVPVEKLDDNATKTSPIPNFYDYAGAFGNIRHEGGIAFNSGKKPIKMIQNFMEYFDSNDFIVMDFFSGSASTAHAVMQMNLQDNGHRSFIMVQIPELTEEKSDAKNDGFQNICEIGKERIRRAAKKIAEENPDAKFDGGFRVLKCDTSNMKDVYYNPSEFEPSFLDTMEDNIKEDRTPEDLLFQVMLDLGVLLSSKIEETTIAGKKVFNVADNFLIACFDKDVNDEVIKEIAQKKPYYFVMRDSSMANDSVATNFEQIFATFSPDTVRKVL